MRSAAFLLHGTAAFREIPIPVARFADRVSRRRIDDALVDTFKRATGSNDLDAADDILTVLEKWHGRRMAVYGRERRIGDVEIKAMRAELDRVVALRLS